MGSNHIWHSIRAKHLGEQEAHRLVRMAFLRHIGADQRVRDLFAGWGRRYDLDAAVDALSAALDQVVTVAGLPNRDAVRTAPCVTDGSVTHQQLVHLEQRLWRLVAETRAARAHEMVWFVATILYDAPPPGPPPPLLWLGEDLMGIFDAELAAHAWGTTFQVGVPLSPTRTQGLPKGQRPKRGGDHLAQYAEWYYRARVKEERESQSQLAREYQTNRERENTHLGSRDDPRANTSIVRAGIAEAQRLLELPVPPWQWPVNDFLAAMKVKGQKR